MPTYTTHTDLMHLGIVVPSGNLIELDAETAERLGDKVSLVAPQAKTPVAKTAAPDTGESIDAPPAAGDTIDSGEPATDETDSDGSTLIGVAHTSSLEDTLQQAAKPSSKTEKTK